MCVNIFGSNCFNLKFKINVVVTIILSIVIIINFVLTLWVSTTSLSHDREPCEIKVVFNHTCSLHTCLRRVAKEARTPKWLSTEGNCFTAGGFPSDPIPIRVCAKQEQSGLIACNTMIETAILSSSGQELSSLIACNTVIETAILPSGKELSSCLLYCDRNGHIAILRKGTIKFNRL